MSIVYASCFVTQDEGLLRHWQKSIRRTRHTHFASCEAFLESSLSTPIVIWLDMSNPDRPPWTSSAWRTKLGNSQIRLVAASSNPKDQEAMAALDAGCVGYCHAFANVAALKKIRTVVEEGQVWIGQNLMQRLLHNVERIASSTSADANEWKNLLTPREIEVALLAGNGASNSAIAGQCKISERTVKAHLSAVFEKLNVSDRLQLALRIHGIH